jgi:hypothetical protein
MFSPSPFMQSEAFHVKYVYLFLPEYLVCNRLNLKHIWAYFTLSAWNIYFKYFRGSNQRLEFLGDTVLQLIASEYLYKYFPEHHEGHLSVSVCPMRSEALIGATVKKAVFWDMPCSVVGIVHYSGGTISYHHQEMRFFSTLNMEVA